MSLVRGKKVAKAAINAAGCPKANTKLIESDFLAPNTADNPDNTLNFFL